MRFDLKPAFGSLLLAAGALLASCGGGGGSNGGGGGDGAAAGTFQPDVNPGLPPATSTSPQNTGDGWNTSTPTAEGIDEAMVSTALQVTTSGSYPGVDSILVIRHGLLVAEGYFNGYGRETLHDLRSSGKSFTSAMTGIAIDHGLLQMDEPVAQILPQFDRYANMDDRKRAMTVRHLLNMASGLDCDDFDPGSPGNEDRMYEQRDWVKFILDLRMIAMPGAAPKYCTGGVIVLGRLITQRSGQSLDAYAYTWLFGPLGIQSATWRRDPSGDATGGGGLKLRPRDAAKLGQLYLNGGIWNGARVVPAAWVEQSSQSVETLDNQGYGLLWWKRQFRYGTGTVASYFTNGNGGNYVFVIPELDVVIVFTGSNYNSPAGDQPYIILEQRLLPAVH